VDDKPVCEHCLGSDEVIPTSKTLKIDQWNNLVQLAKWVRNPMVSITHENKATVDELLLMESKLWADCLARAILEMA
jgi:hypothetical protein